MHNKILIRLSTVRGDFVHQCSAQPDIYFQQQMSISHKDQRDNYYGVAHIHANFLMPLGMVVCV